MRREDGGMNRVVCVIIWCELTSKDKYKYAISISGKGSIMKHS